jgi:Ca2+-binding RTX toxin-like protein
MTSTRLARVRRAGLAAGAATALGLVAVATTANPAGATQSPSASVASDTLTVQGTNASELLALRLATGTPGVLDVDFGDDGSAEFSFDRATFSHMDVFLRAGDDQFRVDQVNGAFPDETLTIYGGSGRDTMNGGDGVEVFYGGSGADSVDGNKANDVAYLGSGADSFTWDPGDGSDIVEGQSGIDTLDFNGAGIALENMFLTPNGSRALFHRDQANINMDMDGVERLDLDALGGVDTIRIDDMSGTDFRRADVDLGDADGAVDVLTVNGTATDDRVSVVADDGSVAVNGLTPQTRITGSEVTDRLQINTLDGNDRADVDGGVFGLILPVVDLGAGQA